MPKLYTNNDDFKIGQIVLVNYGDKIMQGKIIKFSSRECGILFWKKIKSGAMVMIPIMTKTIFNDDWSEEEIYKWYPLSEIM
jgi:hypothetical protein